MTGNSIASRGVRRVFVALVALLACATAHAEVKVTYVANAGVMVEGGGKKVLIDALFDEGIKGYMRIPRDMRTLLRDAEPPFDDVDLVLVSHDHMDHFGPRTMTRHLRANPKATLVCTPQTRQSLERHIANHAGIAERIVAVYPEEGETFEGTYNGIELRVFNLHHGRNNNPPIENLGFAFDVGGMSVLHTGDTEAGSAVFELYEFKKRHFDVAILPVWLLTYTNWGQVVYEQIQPRHVVAVHMPLEDAPANYFGQHASYQGRKDALKDFFPDAVLLETPGDSRTFEAEDSE